MHEADESRTFILHSEKHENSLFGLQPRVWKLKEWLQM